MKDLLLVLAVLAGALASEVVAQGTPCEYPIRDLRRCSKRVPHAGHTPSGNGCGPRGQQARTPQGFGRASFRATCNTHDICYDTCNSDRTACDQAFSVELERVCRQTYRTSTIVGLELLTRCMRRAELYSLAAMIGGGSYYDAAQLQACECCEARWSGTLRWTVTGKYRRDAVTATTSYSERSERVGSGQVTFGADPAEITNQGGAFVVDSFAARDFYSEATALTNSGDCVASQDSLEVNTGTADGGMVLDKSALIIVSGQNYSILFPVFGIETYRTKTTETFEQCPSDMDRRLVSTTSYKGKSDLGVLFRTEGRYFPVDATNPRRFRGNASTVNTDTQLTLETKFEWDFFQP
jgi:Group XII secretory phospholipase A2 precursor (PLA2G12)